MAGPQPLRVNARLAIPARELEVSFARSGGPGGQNVNKVESKVVLRFSVAESEALGEHRRRTLLAKLAGRLTTDGALVVHASRYREQARNLEDARERLAATLREALQPERVRRETKPTRSSKERRLATKRRRSDVKRLRRERPE